MSPFYERLSADRREALFEATLAKNRMERTERA